jgi:hypothetical protein
MFLFLASQALYRYRTQRFVAKPANPSSLLTCSDDAVSSHRCSKCDKAFTRSDLLKRHERGHERWDVTDSVKQNVTKRRKVAFEDSSSSTGASSWSPEDQLEPVSSVPPPHPHEPAQSHFPAQSWSPVGSQLQQCGDQINHTPPIHQLDYDHSARDRHLKPHILSNELLSHQLYALLQNRTF